MMVSGSTRVNTMPPRCQRHTYGTRLAAPAAKVPVNPCFFSTQFGLAYISFCALVVLMSQQYLAPPPTSSVERMLKGQEDSITGTVMD